MVELKDFLENQRKIAEDVLAMRRKASDDKIARPPKPKPDPKPVLHVDVNTAPVKKCFRCGFNHLIKDCRVPATIECRKCHKKGHIENVCRSNLNNYSARDSKDNPRNQQGNGTDGSVSACNSNKSVKLPIEQVNTDHGTCNVL